MDKRTWFDAAAEVAWCACSKALFWSPRLFLWGCPAHIYVWNYLHDLRFPESAFIRVDPFHGAGGNNFDNFKTNFRNWLEDRRTR